MMWRTLCLVMGWMVSVLALADCDQLPKDEWVGNAGCLMVRGDRVLMVQQRLNGSWGLPGGTAESGERAVCTALRETLEETGLKVQVEQHLLTLRGGFHIYRCSAADGQTPDPNDWFEIQSAGWKDSRQRAELPWRFASQRKKIEALIQQQKVVQQEN